MIMAPPISKKAARTGRKPRDSLIRSKVLQWVYSMGCPQRGHSLTGLGKALEHFGHISSGIAYELRVMPFNTIKVGTARPWELEDTVGGQDFSGETVSQSPG